MLVFLPMDGTQKDNSLPCCLKSQSVFWLCVLVSHKMVTLNLKATATGRGNMAQHFGGFAAVSED